MDESNALRQGGGCGCRVIIRMVGCGKRISIVNLVKKLRKAGVDLAGRMIYIRTFTQRVDAEDIAKGSMCLTHNSAIGQMWWLVFRLDFETQGIANREMQ